MKSSTNVNTGDSSRCLVTLEALHDIVEDYLHSANMREVAADMRREAKEKNKAFAGSMTAVGKNPCVGGAVGKPFYEIAQQSRLLEWILCQHAITKCIIRQLLHNGEEKFIRQFSSMGLSPPNALCMQHALHSNERDMWSAQDDAEELYARSWKSVASGEPYFATLHQLIEALTQVTVLPLATLSEEKTLAQERFARVFFRQHRHFASSHAVLAKLMGRFIAPLSLRLGFEHFEAHGITVHAPGTTLSLFPAASHVMVSSNDGGQKERSRVNYFSPSATLWLCVCRKIQMRVLSVLAFWLREYPRHFDDEMRRCICRFLDTCCETTQQWGDCPSQLIAMVESVRTGVTASVAATAASAGSSIRDCTATPAAEKQSSTIMSEGVTSAFLLCELPNFDFTAPLDECWMTRSGEVVRFCLSVSAGRYAEALTAFHLHLFLSLQAEELLQVAQQSSAAFLCSSSFCLSPAGLFLASSTELSSWTISVLLHAAAADGFQGRLAVSKLSPAKNFVDVYTHLVEVVISLLRLNNLHALVAVLVGLEHPIVRRVVAKVVLLEPHLASALKKIEHLSTTLGVSNNDKKKAPGQLLNDYISSIDDSSNNPVTPPLQYCIAEMTRLQHEMPSFLTINADELYPSASSTKRTGNVVVVHWKKYMSLDRVLSRVIAWQADAQPLVRDEVFEKQFKKQMKDVVHSPWRLAQLANELLAVL